MEDKDEYITRDLDSIFLFYPAKLKQGKWSCFKTVYVESDYVNKKPIFHDRSAMFAEKLKGNTINIKDKYKYSFIFNGLIRVMNPVLCLTVFVYVGAIVFYGFV